MKQFKEFVRKEFYHILRDKRSLLLLLAMPIVLMIIFGFAISNEIKNNSLAVYDMAKDEASQKIIEAFKASKYFNITYNIYRKNEIEKVFRQNKAALVIVIPSQFNSNLIATNKAAIQIIADASDPNTATILINHATAIITEYQSSLNQQANIPYQIQTETRMLYNPELKSAYSFVPGVMGLILMLISAMMTSVAIVREKELGTMEVLLVSPLNPLLIVIAKAIPYFLISVINVLTIIALSVFAMGLPVEGNFFLLLAESMLFIISCLSLGLLISTMAQSQQVALLISLLVLMLPTMLLSGFIFPVENMPKVLQWISNIVPATWYILMIKAIMLKGLGFASVWKENLVLIAMTIFFLAVSIKRFNVRLE
jgi:ABC-2 type transport system permease protein